MLRDPVYGHSLRCRIQSQHTTWKPTGVISKRAELDNPDSIRIQERRAQAFLDLG